MDDYAFKLIKDNGSWWYCGKKKLAQKLLRSFLLSKDNVILDVGAGYGAMINALIPFGQVTALEPDSTAKNALSKLPYIKVVGSFNELGSERFSLILAFDVVEHIEDDTAFLKKLESLLKHDGIIIINVPAYQWLWSKHDLHNGHFRRYTITTLKNSLQKAGFSVIYKTYWNMLLFPIAALARLLNISGGNTLHMHRFLNSVLSAIMSFETSFIPTVKFPYGLSVVIVAHKKNL